MTREDQTDPMRNIDPSMIILGLGYATSLIVAVGWLATFIL
jgi:hypothetical protein